MGERVEQQHDLSQIYSRVYAAAYAAHVQATAAWPDVDVAANNARELAALAARDAVDRFRTGR